MTSHAAPAPPRRAPRPSLAATVLRLTAVAAIAAVLVWSVLFVDLLHKRADASAVLTPSSGQASAPRAGAPAQAPAPVTTRTS